jgi:hypothetical protein
MANIAKRKVIKPWLPVNTPKKQVNNAMKEINSGR